MGLALITCVFVAEARLTGVEVFNGVCVCGVVGVLKDVPSVPGIRVLAGNVPPGVRKRLIQTGWVSMEGSTGSMNPLGLCVRKSLFGSSIESILAFSFQLGAKRRAHCPAMITHRNPSPRIRGIMNQSRRSCSGTFIVPSTDWQSHEDGRARICYFVMTGTFQPDTSMMGIDHATRNGKPETGSAALELGLPGGM